jgi:lysophospholipase L1-like esterase
MMIAPLHRVLLIAALVTLAISPATSRAQTDTWRATWAASPISWRAADPIPPPVKSFALTDAEQTIRNIVHVSAGGDKCRIRISNAFGTEPLQIGNAHVAIQEAKSGIVAGTDRAVTFNGETAISIPPGAEVLSDPIALQVPAAANLAVSMTTKGPKSVFTVHAYALQTSYLAPGDQAAAATLSGEVKETSSWLYLTEVQVAGRDAGKGTIVAYGDSITDGALTTPEMNRRWPNLLYERFAAKKRNIAVTDAGIAGNRLLHDSQGVYGTAFGVNALARFERDVLSQAGVRSVIVLLGINDIGQPGSGGIPLESAVTAQEIEGALSQLADHAHERGIRVMVATLIPFGGAKAPGYYSAEKDQIRQEVNTWIRQSQKFDGVADFEMAVQDPTDPKRMRADFDGSDHLHPNDAGDKAMADSIPLSFFERKSKAK